MRPAHEANVTTASAELRASGVWTLAGGATIIDEGGGPATILVPSEQVRLLAVDLPLAGHAKRIAALPFAIEDRIAESAESVHLALGAEITPRRYLAGVVRHELIAAWVAEAESAGLASAAIVPDALALPQPGSGEWAVEQKGTRAIVRAGDGTGFAISAAMLLAAWESAGRPAVTSYGDTLAAEIGASPALRPPGQLLSPALDLRQGLYARRHASLPNMWRRLGWIVAAGAAAHVLIAGADTLMLRSIADRREAATRALLAERAPGAALGENLAGSVADLLPSGSVAPPSAFLPGLNRVSAALAPVAGSFTVRTMAFEGNALTLDLDGTDPGLVTRIDSALKAAGVAAQVTGTAGSVRISARAA